MPQALRKIMKVFKISLFLLLTSVAQSSFSCDLCSVYISEMAHGKTEGRFNVSLFEQYTHFRTTQRDGVEVPNDVGQYLNSSITQIVLGYQATDRLSIQLNVPYIYRYFRRPENFSNDLGQGTNIEHGTEKGLGDVSILGNYQAYETNSEDFTFSWNVQAGVKFPTGNTGRISEELREVDVDDAPESGIHGHDLTLGTGSFDALTGMSIYTRWKRVLFTANMQYAMRTEGDYNYRFANDITWAGGPGYYLFLEHGYTVAVQANVSGESKGRDSFQGTRAEDTGITAVYLGPKLTATWSSQLSADVGADFPVVMDNTAFQAVPDYKIHAGITWSF